MTSRIFSSREMTAAFILLLVVPIMLAAQSQPAATPPAKPAAASAATPMGKAFDTPQEAADAVIKAAADYDVDALNAIFGPDGKEFISGGDQVQDKNKSIAFGKEAQAKNSISISKSNPNEATLIIGDEEWPFPVPLIKKNGKWYFDSRTGAKNIVYRRIGANELDAITVCRGYVDAQKQYSLTIHDDSGVNQYAQRIFSSPGKQDGLYWTNADGTSAGPIGKAVADAIAEGYSTGKGGFHGYYFKILKGQGPAAPMGKINYVIEGIMIGGFALAAAPTEYRVTGVKSFIVSNDGIVYQKDLGPDTLTAFKNMELYNPDKTWQATDDQWPDSAAPVAAESEP